MNSSPTSVASTGLCKCTFGSPGMAPNKTSSILGCSAAVTEMVSPSQLRPAVIHKMCSSLTLGGRSVKRDTGCVDIFIPPGFEVARLRFVLKADPDADCGG